MLISKKIFFLIFSVSMFCFGSTAFSSATESASTSLPIQNQVLELNRELILMPGFYTALFSNETSTCSVMISGNTIVGKYMAFDQYISHIRREDRLVKLNPTISYQYVNTSYYQYDSKRVNPNGGRIEMEFSANSGTAPRLYISCTAPSINNVDYKPMLIEAIDEIFGASEASSFPVITKFPFGTGSILKLKKSFVIGHDVDGCDTTYINLNEDTVIMIGMNTRPKAWNFDSGSKLRSLAGRHADHYLVCQSEELALKFFDTHFTIEDKGIIEFK